MIETKRSIERRGKNLYNILRFSIREFRKDRCDLRATSLTFITLVSVAPVLAFAFGIAKGFGFHELFQKRLLALAVGQEEIMQEFFTFATNYLEKTKGGLMAVIGVLVLGYSIIRLMGQMENAFNKIWWVTGDRPLIRKFTDYIALSITATILLIFSSSGNIFITAYLERFITWLSIPDAMESLISLGFNIFPFFPIWILFIFFYIFMPNKKVDIKAATAGGIVAGSIYQLVQMSYLKFQVGVSGYNAIYGSFAALPLFLIWLQLSWSILLFGAEVAFSWENRESLEAEDLNYSNLSLKIRKLIILRLVLLCVKRFANKEAPATGTDIAREMKIPLKIVKRLLEKLISSKVLLEVNLKDGISGYVPAHDIECLTLMDVVTAYEEKGEMNIPVGGTLEFEALEASLDAFVDSAVECKENRPLKDI